jgi:hypothetical protein
LSLPDFNTVCTFRVARVISIFSSFYFIHLCYRILLAVCCHINSSLSHSKQFQTTIHQYIILHIYQSTKCV